MAKIFNIGLPNVNKKDTIIRDLIPNESIVAKINEINLSHR